MRDEGTFGVEETVDPDGMIRLSLTGELDHLASQALLGRLDERRTAGEAVRLDLSRLEFIDSSGVRAILVSVREAASAAWHIEVDPRVSRQVKRVFDLLGIGSALWPEAEEAS